MLLIADAEALPIKSDCLNIVFSITVLQNLAEPMEGLKEAYRVLKKDGRAFITIPKKVEKGLAFKKKVEEVGFTVEEILDLEDVPDLIGMFLKV